MTPALEATKGHAHNVDSAPALAVQEGTSIEVRRRQRNDESRMNLLVGVGRRGLDGGVAADDGARRDLGDNGGADEEGSHIACRG
jgi:hypothetical protein